MESVTNHGLAEEDTKDRYIWRSLVWGEVRRQILGWGVKEDHCTVDKFLDE
jgi:hypothetical protein